MAHHSGWRSCFSRHTLTEGGSGKSRDDFSHVPSPSEWITRAEVICLLTAPPFLRNRLLAIRMERLLHQSNTHAMKDRLEPLHSRAAARCASRGTSETIGGIFDRQGRRYIVFDVDATRQTAAPSSAAL